MYELSIKTRFSAAHHLVGYPGSCAAHHGHNWDVIVFIAGTELDETGLLVDFRKVKEAVKGVLHTLDHADLNVLPPFVSANPTSEHLARHIYESAGAALNNDRYHVSRVTVCETPETSASYWGAGGEAPAHD